MFKLKQNIREVIFSCKVMVKIIFMCFEYWWIRIVAFIHEDTFFDVSNLEYVGKTSKGYDLYLDDKLVIYNKMPSSIPGVVAFRNDQDTYGIVMNSRMAKQPLDFIKTAIAHEEGHIIKGHLLQEKQTDSFEYEADIYAFEEGHDILSLLKKYQVDYMFDTASRIRNIQSAIMKRKQTSSS